jgi:predicted MFS family arabinose efflux permease
MNSSEPVAVDLPVISAAVLCMVVGPSVFLLMPIHVGVLQSTLQLNESSLGLLAASDLIGIALASLLAPLWINRLPWRMISTVGLAGLVICNLVALVVTEPGQLFTLRLLAGLLTGVVASVVMGILAHSRSPDRVMAAALFCQVFYQSIAFLLMPGWIEARGLPAFLIPVVLLQLVALVGVLRFPLQPIIEIPETTNVGQPSRVRSMPAILLLVGMAAFFVGQTSLWAFVELIGNNMGMGNVEVGYALAVSTFISLIGPAWGALTDTRFGRLRPLLVAGIAQIIALSLMDAASSVWLYAGVLSLFQIFWNMAVGFQYGALVDADHSNRFVVMVPAAQCLGIALGPMLGGIALEVLGSSGVYLVSGVGLVAYLVLVVSVLGSASSTDLSLKHPVGEQ